MWSQQHQVPGLNNLQYSMLNTAVLSSSPASTALASCLIYARALLEYVIIIMWLRSVIKILPSVKFAEDKGAHFPYSP